MKKILFIMVVFRFLVVSVLATDNMSDNLTVPHTFASGEIISSSKINENFTKIQTEINTLKNQNSIVMGAYELTPGMTYDNLDVSNLSIIYGNLTTGTSNITIKGLSGGVKGQLLKIFNTADVYLNGVNIILECENQNAIQQFRSPLNSNNKKQYINSGKYLETFFDGSYWRISTMGM